MNVDDASDGKPVFVQLGVHHAREWPSAEMPMEWASDLISGFGEDERTTRLLKRARVNRGADRQPRRLQPVARGAGRPGQPVGDRPDLQADPGRGGQPRGRRPARPHRRDPRRPADRPVRVQAPQLPPRAGRRRRRKASAGRARAASWASTPTATTACSGAAAGRSTSQTDDTYRGEAPFSEPETQNVRHLVSHRQVTTLITNHTYSNLILRPPGLAQEGLSPDEERTQGTGRRDGRAERLHQPVRLAALRHDRDDRGLELHGHRRAGLHVRDRAQSSSTRRTTRSSTSIVAPATTPARATARPTSWRWRALPTRSSTRC